MDKRITVLETIRQGKIGGGESHLLSLVSKIDTSKFRPVVLSFTDGEMIDMLRERGIKTYIVHTTKPFNLLLTGKVLDIIKNENVQLVHAHGTRATSNSFYAAKRAKIPIIYTVHAWSFHPCLRPFVYKARVRSEKFLTEKVNETICVSYVNQEEGRQLFKLRNSRVIQNGIDTEKFDHQKDYGDIKNELGISPDKFLVGYIVRMTEQKDPLTLLKAIKIVKEKNNNINFMLVGDGELKPMMESYVEENSLGDTVFFENFRTDIPRVLSNLDAYVLPSLWEGLPIGLLEAMAMQKKVIVSDAEANKELINNGVNGFVFQRENEEELAEAILKMYENPSNANKMAQRAKQLIDEKYALGNMVNRIEDTYFEILEKSKQTN